MDNSNFYDLSFLAPGHYTPEKSVKALDSTPQYTFGMRTQVEKPADTPGIGFHIIVEFNNTYNETR